MSSLLRSTKLVRYFTGAARTLLLNSAKTAEVNLLINPKTLNAANNVLLRDYATTKKSEGLDPMLQKLDLDVRRFGRITKKDIDDVFDVIKSRNDITSSQSLLIIRCCGELVPEELPEHRTLLVQKIWNVLTERGIPMDVSHYNALLRVYLENEHPFSPAQFLDELEKKGLQPNRVTYQRLMWRYCQEGDVEGATKVLEKMRELNFPVSEPVLNALVMGHAYHGDTDGAKAVLETMSSAGLQPTNRTYTLLACGFAKKGDIEGVESTIQTAKDKESFLSDRDLLEIIEYLTIGGHSDKVEQILPYLQKHVGYNQDACNLILKLLNKGHVEIAKTILKSMPKTSSTEDTPFKGAFFVKQLVRASSKYDDVIKTCQELEEEGQVPRAIYIATECALNNGYNELAQKLFKELEKRGHEMRSHYYWPLLIQKGKENDEEGLLQLLRDMINNKMLTGETLRDYVISYMLKKDTPNNVILKLQIANVPVILCARNVMVELLETGKIQLASDIARQYLPRGNYSLVSRPLLNALRKTKEIESFVNIVHVLSSKPQNSQIEDDSVNEDAQTDNTDDSEVSRLVNSAIKILAKPDLCEQLLQKLYSKGLNINDQTAQAIEQYLGENMTSNISELLSKLTSSELEMVPIENIRRASSSRSSKEIELLIAQLKTKEGSNVNRLQRQLLNIYIQENNVSKLNGLLDELKASKYDLSPGLLAQLYEFYCVNNEIDKANEYKEILKEKSPDFELNKYKLIVMANALVACNRFDEAIQFLKENKNSQDSESGYKLGAKCWQILNTLAEQKDDAKVKEMTQTLINSNYIDPSNVILGPSIKVHILKGDLDSALSEFEQCCKQYRSTPWKGELMKALILKEDASKLQWLADLSTQIHGEVNILHDLVLAFVECGRLRQARRILETPGLQSRNRRLDDACVRYVEEGKSEYLEGLLEATKELSHIDRSNIFYHLLVTYCKAGATDKALGLWTVLQEDGEVPSTQFLVYLANYLKSKNRKVPFVIPDETPTSNKNVKPEPVVTPKKVNKPTKSDVTTTIENLIKNDELSQALDIALRSINTGVIPTSKVLKYLLKNLALDGQVEKIQQLGHCITEPFKRRLTYDNKLTLAIFTRGAGPQHIENVLEAMKAAKTEEDTISALKMFPRSTALATAVSNDEVLAKCIEVVELAAAKGQILPANLLWMELILLGKADKAANLWDKYLKNSNVVIFRRLLQESHLRKEPQMMETLIATLKTNSVIPSKSLGNAYSRLLNFYITEGKLTEAENTLEEALKSGLSQEDINTVSLKRLKAAVEANGKEFKYSF